MTEEQKALKLQEVNQILKDNGIDIRFSADWGTGYCEIKYHGETIVDLFQSDCIVKLGDKSENLAG